MTWSWSSLRDRFVLPLTCIGVASLLASCQHPGKHVSGSELRTRILGTWMTQVRKGSLEASSIKTFRADGTAVGTIHSFESRKSTRFHHPEVHFKDRWRVVDDVIETYDIESNAPDIFPPGTVLRDRLIRISEFEATFIDLGNGRQRYVMQRLPPLAAP